MSELPIETHPLHPFLPEQARWLFLGSFPPPLTRWSMQFFYPNFNNDFWRIMGTIFFHDRNHFVVANEKRFDKEAIEHFAREQGFAFFDTATRVRRLKGNASDAFLEIVEATDIGALLCRIPQCENIITTGGLAGETLCRVLGVNTLPKIGEFVWCPNDQHSLGRDLKFWRMPSSSRAYPLKLEKKAEFYQRLFE